MQYTIKIFKNLHQNLPPHFPDDVKRGMADALREFEADPTSLEDLEEKMLKFGYVIWPWNTAYREFYNSCKKRMGGQLLTTKSELAINDALVAIHKDLRNLTNQELLSTEKSRYLNRVSELEEIARSIRGVAERLHEFADAEKSHPTLAEEIRAKVRGFEHRLCELGPRLDHHEVENAIEFFHGRRAELDRLRGINNKVVINFED